MRAATRRGRRAARPLLKRFVRADDGAVVVEFALMAPLLFLLIFAIIDFGRAYYTLNALVTSVREGARYAALRIDPSDPASLTQYESEVRRVVRQAAPTAGGSPIKDNQIELSVDGAANTVTVRVKNYPFSLVTPLVRTVGTGTLLLTRQATFELENTGTGS